MRSRMVSLLIGVPAVAVLAPAAGAHQGHGDPALLDSVMHYLIEPLHLPLVLGLLAAAVIGWRWVSGKLEQRAARSRRR